MQQFRCHKVVEAAQVIGIRYVGDDGFALITRDGEIGVGRRWTEKHAPYEPASLVGGYAVRYEDGYLSWSPAEVFEKGYKLASLDPKDGALPVAGYQPQTQEKVALVNVFKADEERLLRKLDALKADEAQRNGQPALDQRWLAIGRTQLEQAFMAINRAVFQPKRSALPEDSASVDELPDRATRA